MQKNTGFFTFQFSYSRKNVIRIRRFAVSKRSVQSASISVFLVTVFSTFGIGLHGLIKSTAFASTLQDTSLSTRLATSRLDASTFDYARPKSSEAVAVNSGGPVDISATDAAATPRLRTACPGQARWWIDIRHTTAAGSRRRPTSP